MIMWLCNIHWFIHNNYQVALSSLVWMVCVVFVYWIFCINNYILIQVNMIVCFWFRIPVITANNHVNDKKIINGIDGYIINVNDNNCKLWEQYKKFNNNPHENHNRVRWVYLSFMVYTEAFIIYNIS